MAKANRVEEIRAKLPPLLDRTIKRILNEKLPLTTAPMWLIGILVGSQEILRRGGLTRRMAEGHVLRYLMCKEELKAGRHHG